MPGQPGACGYAGADDSSVLVVGMAPGRDELAAGEPFVGGSGSLLWNTGKQAGLLRQNCRILNVSRCWPTAAGGKNLSREQIAACSPTFDDALRAFTGSTILCLGGDALERVTGLSGIDRWRGYLLAPEDCEGVEVRRAAPKAEVYKAAGKCAACKGSGVLGGAPDFLGDTSGQTQSFCERCGGTGKRKPGDPKWGWATVREARTLPPNVRWIIGAYHPSYVMRMGRKPLGAFLQDIARAVRAAAGEIASPSFAYATTPMPDNPLDTVAFDIETEGREGLINRIGLSTGDVTWTAPWGVEALGATRAALTPPDRMKVAHNIQFDLPRLESEGVPIPGRIFDTMLAGQLLEPDLPKALRSMAPVYLDLPSWKDRAASDPEFYNAMDARVTLDLFRAQRELLARYGMWELFTGTMMPGVRALIRMTQTGIRVDQVYRARLLNDLRRYLEDQLFVWHEHTAVSASSPAQIARHLYGTLGLPTQRDKHTQRPTADVRAISALRALAPDHAPMLDCLLEIRRTEKVLSNYGENLKVDHRDFIHPTYLPLAKDDVSEDRNKGAASTGRLAAANPNIMQVPKGWKHRGHEVSEARAREIIAQGGHVMPPVRNLFIPRERDWSFIEADYSQIELRLIAAMSRDEAMTQALKGDVHEEVRAKMGTDCSRTLAKSVNYATWYGGTDRTIAGHLRAAGIPTSVEEVRRVQQTIASMFSRAWAWKESVAQQVRTAQFLVNPMGRRRNFYGGTADVPEGVNFMPQSTAASILWALLPDIQVAANCGHGLPNTTIHDAVLIEVPDEGVVDASTVLKYAMEREWPEIAPGFRCPVDVAVGKSWGAMHALNEKAVETG